MMKTFLIFCLVLLPSCSSYIIPADIPNAEAACKDRGGWTGLASDTFGNYRKLTIWCEDKTIINMEKS